MRLGPAAPAPVPFAFAVAVASTEPARIRVKAPTTPGVRASSRKMAPAATATAGLTYVITVALVGPASLINSRKATKAIAVQITPRPARATRT
ncbi:hypothetical protein OHA51_15730 [Streptomyces sp. NBC_00589]|nr:hypothetical protein [Streptomyces sp. NBC_00589]WTI39628.1 hypothetical protein OIC96_34000 [Streptomyces sp. NBC_00775]WUB26693.1 hypothetical protein OHA51_15730 [Streptomyces sp. NBC_00589]